MGKCYFELRKKPSNGNGLSTDTMRHLKTRQHLGKSVIVCDEPRVMLSAARKQWLRLTRYVQKQRAATLDADKILKYTHAVTHMQHMKFTAQPPLTETEASTFFITPKDIDTLPPFCMTAYITAPLTKKQARELPDHLSTSALVVDYKHTVDWPAARLSPKKELETELARQWQRIDDFLHSYQIKPDELFDGPLQNVDALDEALDILLGASQRFLHIAADFNQALELARPLKLSKHRRQQYDAASLLAHRVQALSPGAFTQQFLEAYNEDDTFFLHDRGLDLLLLSLDESPHQTIARHRRAKRHYLADALTRYHLRGAPTHIRP